MFWDGEFREKIRLAMALARRERGIGEDAGVPHPAQHGEADREGANQRQAPDLIKRVSHKLH